MKRVLGVIVISFVLHWSSGGFVASFAAMLREPVAIVCFLSGKAFAKVDGKRSELKLFQRLTPGTLVETETGSKVVLTFSTGDRYEFAEGASGTVGRTGLVGRKGAIQKLSPVPATIDIAPIATEEKPGTRLAAARIRAGATAGKPIVNLYPADGAATAAQTAVLRFDPVEGYQKYKVDLEDERGNAIFSVETPSTAVQIPSAVLRPGASYYFRVRTLDAERPAMRGEAVFSTLSEDNARRRAELKAHVEETREPSLLALLAEFDRSVGMHRESCEELKAALDQSPANQPIAEALARFRCLKPEGSATKESKDP
jgi:hypothetical protein